MDPFYAAHSIVATDMAGFRVRLTRSALDDADAKDDDCARVFKTMADVVSKLRATVTAVEKTREKFSHINDAELAARDALVKALESVRPVCIAESIARRQNAPRATRHTPHATCAESRGPGGHAKGEPAPSAHKV